MNTVYVDFYRAITLAEVSRRIEEAYLGGLAGAARRTVASVARRWQGKIVVTPGGVGAEVEPVKRQEQQRLSDMLDLPKKVFQRSGARTPSSSTSSKTCYGSTPMSTACCGRRSSSIARRPATSSPDRSPGC